MCLSKVDKETKQFEYGWKTLAKKNGKLYSPFFFRKSPYHVNRWMIDNSSKSPLIGGGYTPGFHFYKTRADARYVAGCHHCIVRKVLVKNIVASGIQDGFVVGVARQMKILE